MDFHNLWQIWKQLNFVFLDAAALLQQGKKVVISEFYDEIIFQVKKNLDLD